ncbi:alanine racemase (plasmid) [Rhizobium sp. 32-5/1]|uniref:alanine racemase n=1 Tax=Rhizobium sp. 32-5/1 TaxID=3019602 RepID=UPI00240DD435|nr:alanine racemase [Rhizobium sp. 32-5/1]WEZ85957.1 alanine racemase [Rhizobium sp. 32-5/1]
MTTLLMPSPELHTPSLTSAAEKRGSWYEIDVDAIRHNYKQVRGHLPVSVKVFACLKRNGYGCGAGAVAGILSSEGVDGFAVASLLDAVAIRDAGVRLPILLYPGALPVAASTVESLDLTITVSSAEELRQWRAALKKTRAFVKVDLGFFRAGATPQEVCRLLVMANAHADVKVEGIYAHMSELPTTKPSDASDQLGRMQVVLQHARNLGVRPAVAMMSSTEGVLNHPEMDLDAVDPGALFIGLPESDKPVRPVKLRHALKAISTSLIAVKRIDASMGPVPAIPGFEAGMLIGVLGMGWGDGYPRDIPKGSEAIVGGKRVRLLRPAHLEHLRIDLTEVPEARFGDRVVLLGHQGNQVITHDELARLWGTDMVGLYGQLRDHIPRLYTGSHQTNSREDLK